ncbi:MAG: hypothetical protein ACJARS_000573 [bacterium]|jgi:hypothetical protein
MASFAAPWVLAGRQYVVGVGPPRTLGAHMEKVGDYKLARVSDGFSR